MMPHEGRREGQRSAYQVATEVLTHEVGPRVSPERSRGFERIAASALLLQEHGAAPA